MPPRRYALSLQPPFRHADEAFLLAASVCRCFAHHSRRNWAETMLRCANSLPIPRALRRVELMNACCVSKHDRPRRRRSGGIRYQARARHHASTRLHAGHIKEARANGLAAFIKLLPGSILRASMLRRRALAAYRRAYRRAATWPRR